MSAHDVFFVQSRLEAITGFDPTTTECIMRARIMTLPVCVRSRKHKPWSSNDLTYPLRKADGNVHERANAAGNEAGRDPAGVFRSCWPADTTT